MGIVKADVTQQRRWLQGTLGLGSLPQTQDATSSLVFRM